MPTVKNQRRRNKTLCEKSTQLAVNIAKLSSLYLARITLSSEGPAKGSQASAAAPTTVLIEDATSKRIVEHQSVLASKNVREPAEGGGVDHEASKFIRWFKEKTHYEADPGTYAEASKCIPPPPRVKRA